LIRHRFPVVAHFDWTLAVTFAVPRQTLEPLIAPGLTLDVDGPNGFLAAACVATRGLRPAGLPRFLGMDFFLAGYRVFTRFLGESGKTYRGLQILASETDRWPMAAAGRLLTHYGYRRCRVRIERTAERIAVSTSSGLEIVASLHSSALPPESVFGTWDAARRFAGPAPYTFAAENGKIVCVRGARTNWKPRPIGLIQARAPLLERLAGVVPTPAAAFLVENVDYRWERGFRERPGRP
jgi:uncharacterized protein DUF2071